MSNGRDTQRNRLYKSEHQVFTYSVDFTTVRQAQKFANSVTGSRWWAGLGGPKFVLIKKGRSDSHTSTAWASRNEIRLAPTMFTKFVILHELAHIAMYHINRKLPSHGPDYALVYRRIIEKFMGSEQSAALGLAYDKNGVRSQTQNSAVLKALAGTDN